MTNLFPVDIENICRGNLSNPVLDLQELLAVGGYEWGDHVVIATSHFSLGAFAGDPITRGFRFLAPRSGPNGADLNLIDDLQSLVIKGRYDRVVLGSGDHEFAGVMGAIGAFAHTVAVAPEGSMSRSLRLAVHETILLRKNLEEAA